MPPKADHIDLLAAIDSNADLSPVTKRNYHDRIRAISNRADEKDLLKIILSPDKYIPLMRKWYPLATSHKIHYTAILSLFRYNPEFKEKNKAVHEKWVKAFREADDAVNERYETNKPTDRQVEGYVPYEKLIEVRDSLPAGHIHRLLLDMYTLIKPMRCEYARVAIYRGKVPDKPDPNYINIHGKKANLVLTHFKTRKHHDAYDIELPKELVADLLKSLEDQPREWLFVNTRNEPYTPTIYTQWTSRVFLKLFKKPLTVSLIRHSYINTIDFNTLSIKEKKEIATSMGHTVETQDRYRLLFTDKQQDCDCKCEAKEKD
jgi:hypothetical protein